MYLACCSPQVSYYKKSSWKGDGVCPLNNFLAHLSQRPKGDSLITICPLSVVVVVVGVINFSHFHPLFQTHWANFNETWHKAFWVKGIKVYLNEGPRPFPRGDNYKIAKIHWRNLKIFSRTIGPISTTKHPWVTETHVCSNEGPRPFSKER